MKGRRHITEIHMKDNMILVKNTYCEKDQAFMKPKQATKNTEVGQISMKSQTEGVCSDKTKKCIKTL